MCEKNHNHGLIETWVTPKDSARLRSKLVQLAPGEFMPIHSTGPGREEVITCIFGTIRVTRGNEVHTLRAGEAIFIPENTQHAVRNLDEDHALYCYVVSMAAMQPAQNKCSGCGVPIGFNSDACLACSLELNAAEQKFQSQ